MLDLPRYLLGVSEIALLAGFATLGASALRSRLLPGFAGAPAHLATAVIALAFVIWSAELLGTLGLFDPVPLVILVGLAGAGTRAILPRVAWGKGGRGRPRPQRPPPPTTGPAGRRTNVPTLIALAVAAVAVIKFGAEVRVKLGTGMTGFDSTWYHGPFAVGFFQSGNTWDLHYIAPQFLAWFYPANAEIFHSVGMLAFDRDLLSPLLNLGWFLGCLVAAWCIGRPYGVAPWSLALGAAVLSVPALSDQAGEARNDVVGIFFLLAAIAIAVNAWGGQTDWREGDGPVGGRLSLGPLVLVGLSAGLAAGTKLNFLLPAAVLVVGLALIAPAGGRSAPAVGRGRALGVAGLAALAGGGYWYLRNLLQAGNPLPWIDSIGPISLAAPDQALGGREGHSVLGYLTDGAVWSDWLLPGFRDGLWPLWPLLLLAAFVGLVLCLAQVGASRRPGAGRRGVDGALAVAGLVGLAAAVAWLIAPTSASGPEGMPRGFESGLRYLAPALVLGLALLPGAWRFRGTALQAPAAGTTATPPAVSRRFRGTALELLWRRPVAVATLCLLAAIAIGYPVQRRYLENRYVDPAFTTPGLNAAFAWARSLSDARIATTSTRQYPLYGTDLSNHVQYVGIQQPNGGFVAPSSCRAWRRLLDAGDYDYVIASRDRLEPTKPPYPATARWTEGPGAKIILRKPPTVVFRLTGALDPARCRY